MTYELRPLKKGQIRVARATNGDLSQRSKTIYSRGLNGVLRVYISVLVDVYIFSKSVVQTKPEYLPWMR